MSFSVFGTTIIILLVVAGKIKVGEFVDMSSSRNGGII